jgi:selenocysteine lyase/cysteine desulfurase
LAGSLSTLGSLLWEEVYNIISSDKISRHGILTLVDVGQYTSLCDCDVSQKLIQFLVVADGELEMARDDTGLLVVASSVTSQLEDFGREVFQDSSKVNGSTWNTR